MKTKSLSPLSRSWTCLVSKLEETQSSGRRDPVEIFPDLLHLSVRTLLKKWWRLLIFFSIPYYRRESHFFLPAILIHADKAFTEQIFGSELKLSFFFITTYRGFLPDLLFLKIKPGRRANIFLWGQPPRKYLPRPKLPSLKPCFHSVRRSRIWSS